MQRSTLPSLRLHALAVLAPLVACGPTFSVAPTSEGSTGELTTDGSGGSGGGTTSTSVLPELEESSSTGEPPSSFIEDPDGGDGSFECNLWVQDCPAGYKCNPWANDGGNAWNATRCVPVDPDADEVGGPCTVADSAVSGIDTCPLGAMCWDVDLETMEGVCREFCQGSESNPSCADPETICGGPRDFPLCLPSCCPVEQDCPEGEGCYPVNETFFCVPDASGETGSLGDPCEYINVCNPGLMCADPAIVPVCDASAYGCCTPFCEVGSTSCSLLHPDMECVAWYEEGNAPPGYELTGVCADV